MDHRELFGRFPARRLVEWVVTSFALIRWADLGPYQRSALGRYAARFMTPQMQALRAHDDAVCALGLAVMHGAATRKRKTPIAVPVSIGKVTDADYVCRFRQPHGDMDAAGTYMLTGGHVDSKERGRHATVSTTWPTSLAPEGCAC